MTADDIQAIKIRHGWSSADLTRLLGFKSPGAMSALEHGVNTISASSARLLTLLDACPEARAYALAQWGTVRRRGRPAKARICPHCSTPVTEVLHPESPPLPAHGKTYRLWHRGCLYAAVALKGNKRFIERMDFADERGFVVEITKE